MALNVFVKNTVTVNKCGKNVIRYFTRIAAELKFLIFSFYIGQSGIWADS